MNNLGATSWMLLKDNSYVEIVGFIIDNVIYAGCAAYDAFREYQRLDGVYTKEMATLMSCCDLGSRWDETTNWPVILIWDKGVPRLPERKENE